MPEAPKDVGAIALAWWRSLQRTTPSGERNPNADLGALARLRRAATPLEAAQEAQTIALYRRLYGERLDPRRLESVAVLAATLAHVRDGQPKERSAAAALGTPPGGDRPVLSELRMRRLCAARDAHEALRGFRGVVRLLDGAVPIRDLAPSVLDWLDPERGEMRRTRWLFAYHGAALADPYADRSPPDANATEAAR
jgi:CRISPR system Cascade subunit CasB